MAFWLTVHYPHPNADPDRHPWHVYLQEQFEDIARRFREGHRVMFYETLTHPRQRGVEPRTGSQGIVRVGTVSGPYAPRPPHLAIAEYEDGGVKNWRWGIPTKDVQRGFVARPQVLEQLGMGENGYLRGFGERHSGVREIGAAIFNALVQRGGPWRI